MNANSATLKEAETVEKTKEKKYKYRGEKLEIRGEERLRLEKVSRAQFFS